MPHDAIVPELVRRLEQIAADPTSLAEAEITKKLAEIAANERGATWVAAGRHCMADRRWAIAAVAFSRAGSIEPGDRMALTLAKNLAALQVHRPAVYETIVNAPTDTRFEIVPTADGLPSITFKPDDGPAKLLSLHADPRIAMQAMWQQLAKPIGQGESIALCGIGDGYFLASLAARPPKLFMAMQQTLHIVEPRPQAALLAMMIHDYSGEGGPIRQQRFRWYIGADWRSQLEAAIPGDWLTPPPSQAAQLGLDEAEISAALGDIIRRGNAVAADLQQQVDAYYSAVPSSEWTQIFSAFPPRAPRVLLITTRFSTVLQYSTRDAADAFGQLGWQTDIVIEPTDWQRTGPGYIRYALAEFKPDFVFQIDHQRHEYGTLFPPQLPFACWIQDHLPNLTSEAAGQAVGLRDFVLTGMGSLFAQQYAYPRRQIVDVPQLARVPMRPTQWNSDGADLIYVSNASTPAATAASALIDSVAAGPGRSLIEHAVTLLLDLYAAGRTAHTYYDMRLLLDSAEQAMGVQIRSSDLKDQMVNALFDQLNNVLYRHQALGWAAALAHEGCLKLELYGRGWEMHPTLAEFAKGPVQPGEPMEQLTRRSKINLQLEPYACFSHARLLNGLFAGGFFLIRDHPFNHLTRRLLDFVDRHFDPHVASVAAARASAPSARRERFEQLLVECKALGEQVDPIGLVRDWQRSGVLMANDATLPRMNDVLFDSPASLAAAIDKFIDNVAYRADVSSEQRKSLQSRLSYKAGLDRAMRAIGKLIATEQITTTKAA